jgi:2'-deoxynucleoside 5'-phosphate N-hydrolase
MKAYISVSYSKRKFLDKELKALKDVLHAFEIEPFIFVDQYQFGSNQEKEMMRQAFADIDSSEILIAEVSDKAIGIGIEAGYAKAKNKTIIYCRNINAGHSTTVSGLSDFQIIYADTEDLSCKLRDILKKIAKAGIQ